nr:hypothetical protein [Vibrio alginolyticus]
MRCRETLKGWEVTKGNLKKLAIYALLYFLKFH